MAYLSSPGIYLDQSVLLEVIRNNTDKMIDGLEDIGIIAAIDSVEAGTVEPLSPVTDIPPGLTFLPPTPPAPHPGLSAGIIAAITVGSVVLLAVCVGVAAVVYTK